MKLWRIAAETRQYAADDLSGAGAARHPGRWNDVGEPVLYTAPSISLAVLETAEPAKRAVRKRARRKPVRSASRRRTRR